MTRNKWAIVVVLLLIASPGAAGAGVLEDWRDLERGVRDGLVPREEARRRLIEIHPRLAALAPRDDRPGVVAFPVGGGELRDVGGKNGSGYQLGGYSWYDGKRHTGHPGHDIFIPDRDFLSVDDRTGRPAEVRALCDGLVISVNRDWEPGSDGRGGRYVWVYSATTASFYAYAHLADVTVEPGTRVRAGDALGHVGRTGKNAWPRRSPTHLHLTRMDYDGGRMTPHDTWPDLVRGAGR